MKRQRSARRNTRGFSLVEVLAATVLMAIILSAIGMVTAQWLPNWGRGFVRVQQSEIVALGVERIVADLAAAEMVPTGRATPPFIFDGTEASVTFVRTVLGPNSNGGLELVRIGTAADDRGPALIRARAAFIPASEAVRPSFSDPVVLLRGPYRVSFAYAGEDRVWRDAWPSADRLPRAIRITVRDPASGATLPMSTIAVVRADVPARCVLTKTAAGCRANAAAGDGEAAQPVPGVRREGTQ
jgi:general secretion pathway protein J